MDTPEARLTRLSLSLPPTPKPAGLYKPALVLGGLVYVSGHVSVRHDGTRVTGRVGADLSIEQGKAAARQAGLAILSTLRHTLGSLDAVSRVVRMFGMVNASPDFDQHPAVINGCSELFVEIFGEDLGVGVRSAAGMASLPGNVAVEIDAVFALKT